MLIAGRVVVARALRFIQVIAAAIANADVKQAIFAEVEVAGVMDATGRWNVIHQHPFGCGIHTIVVGQGEARNTVDGALGCVVLTHPEFVEGVVQINVPRSGERRINRDAENATLPTVAKLAGKIERGRCEQNSLLMHMEHAGLR